MSTDHVLVERHPHHATIVLNRPDKLNALTPDMYVRIGQLLAELEADDGVRAVVLRGNGKAFSSGFDLTHQVRADDNDQRRRFLQQTANANRWKIWNMSKPVVAQLHGYCLAGALELVLPSDFLIASESCRLGEPEVLFGTSPAFFAVPWIVNVRRAKQILMTGEYFTAVEAERWGLVTSAVPEQELDQHVAKLVKRLVQLPPAAVRMIKEGVNRVYETLGMRAHIDSWVDSNLLLKTIETDETLTFKEKVRTEGVKAAIAWREELYS
ncbi:MAG: enoyl-CoA hydratase/isomerase family protein [Acidimicrobiia bacterium]